MSEKQFKYIVPGIDGGGSQVFEADSQEELIDKLGKAQENGTAKIRELASQNEQYQQQIQQLQPPQQQQINDPNAFNRQQFFNKLYEHPDEAIAYALEKKLGVGLNDFMQDYQSVRNGANLAVQNAVNGQFAQKHPELLEVGQTEDIHNAEAISKILTENGWTYNLNNLEAAYAVAKTNNQLKLRDMNFAPEATLPHAPSTITRPSGQVNSSDTETEMMSKMTTDQMRKYLENKYAGVRP